MDALGAEASHPFRRYLGAEPDLGGGPDERVVVVRQLHAALSLQSLSTASGKTVPGSR